MASHIGAVAAEASSTAHQQHPSTTSSDDIARALKRHREPDSPILGSPVSSQFEAVASPTKSARLALATTHFAPLTGAAALEDERRLRAEETALNPPATSDNPSHRALSSLMSASPQVMSRLSDAPQSAPTATMEPAAKVAMALASIPLNNVAHLEHRGQVSPGRSPSLVGTPVTESPTAMDVDAKGEDASVSSQHVAGQEERPQPGSLSYPGSLQSTAMAETPTRGMSFPMPGQSSPISSTSKKHKCPYCSTEFTRHHNLKSHLLTHSQEKPYLCTDCNMRFRRLHDLKRHGKLHTGEKPHICPKCDRKFARGDALARHAKGAGGCAGRRSSMGSFVDGDEMDGSLAGGNESTMSGLAYDNGDEEELRRQSVPAINAQHVAGGQNDNNHGPHSRTYPPTGSRSVTSGLYPPNASQTQASTSTTASVPGSMASGPTTTPSISSMPASGGSAALFSQAGMTESPKPLSPGIPGQETSNMGRQRSPSLTRQLQQQMGRRTSELQSPHGGQPRPKLPGLSHPGFAAPGSAAATGFAVGRGAGAPAQPSGDSGNMFAQSDPSVWAYIQTLEEKVKSLSDKVLFLDHEVVTLKKQLETRDGPTMG